MSTLKIEERFRVAADPDRVFRFLIDPEKVVACMPGARFEEAESQRRFLGSVQVKVGAVAVAYKGAFELTEVDTRLRRARAVGEGREKAGAGKVRVQVDLRVTGTGGGSSEVGLEAEANLAGRIVRFGRGMIEGVSRQLFADFASAVRERLESGDAPRAAGATGAEAGAERPIRAIPLLFRTLWAWLRGLFGRR